MEKLGLEPATNEWEALEQLLFSAVKTDKPKTSKILADIFKAVLKLARESHGTLNLKITATVLKELRYSFKIFFPHKHTRKITMFGSARVIEGTPLYEFAREFAKEAVARDFLVITGGGPGIMAAGNEGAQGTAGFGLNIRLPLEQNANPFIDADKRLINYKYFFTRKLFLVKEAWAFAFFPGGFGTFDEAFEVLTLLQTGKSGLIPVVMVEPRGFGFWGEFSEFLKSLLAKGFISVTDKHLYKVFHSPEDALDHVELFYRNYHSVRYVKDGLAIRIKNPIPDTLLKKIQKDFTVLSNGAPFKITGPLPEEENEPELNHLPRIVFPFVTRDYGILRQLIDCVNEHSKP